VVQEQEQEQKEAQEQKEEQEQVLVQAKDYRHWQLVILHLQKPCK